MRRRNVRKLVLLALPLMVLLAGCPTEEQQVASWTGGAKVALVSTTYSGAEVAPKRLAIPLSSGDTEVVEEEAAGPTQCYRASAWITAHNRVGWDLLKMETITRYCIQDGRFTVNPYQLLVTGNGNWGWAWKGLMQYTVYPCAEGDCMQIFIQGEFCLTDYVGWCKTPWIRMTIDPDDPYDANMRWG